MNLLTLRALLARYSSLGGTRCAYLSRPYLKMLVDSIFSSDARSAPDPSWVRGDCPLCQSPVVSNLYYVGGRGYLLKWECWRSLSDPKECTYSRVV